MAPPEKEIATKSGLRILSLYLDYNNNPELKPHG
jgi:hypothetical protein